MRSLTLHVSACSGHPLVDSVVVLLFSLHLSILIASPFFFSSLLRLAYAALHYFSGNLSNPFASIRVLVTTFLRRPLLVCNTSKFPYLSRCLRVTWSSLTISTSSSPSQFHRLHQRVWSLHQRTTPAHLFFDGGREGQYTSKYTTLSTWVRSF